MAFNHIAVIGAGAWGSALALTCVRAGRQVTLWEENAANAAQIADTRESLFLPGVKIDERIVLARDLAAVAAADAVLLVVPAQAVRAASAALAPLLARSYTGDRLRQGYRALQPKIHERSDRGMRPRRGAGDFIGAELRHRRGARHADGGDAGGGRRGACRRAGAGGRVGVVSALSFERPARC